MRRNKIKKKDIKPRRIKSTTVLEIVDRTMTNYSGKMFPSAEPMIKTDGSSKDEIRVFSLSELFAFMDSK